jgi:hypothetical protein
MEKKIKYKHKFNEECLKLGGFCKNKRKCEIKKTQIENGGTMKVIEDNRYIYTPSDSIKKIGFKKIKRVFSIVSRKISKKGSDLWDYKRYFDLKTAEEDLIWMKEKFPERNFYIEIHYPDKDGNISITI